MIHRQRGAISAALVAALSFIGLLLLVGAVCFTGYMSAAGFGADTEANLRKSWGNSQNVLSNYSTKIQEMAQIPDMYKNDLKEVIAAEMSGRYGKEGSQATMQWIKERSQNFDSSLYTKIQQAIEAGRNEFQNSITRVLDIKGIYEANLAYPWRGFWLRAAGYPKENLDKYRPILTDKVEQTFNSGKQDPIKLRN